MSQNNKNNLKLWGGRFQKASSTLLDEFNASVGFDFQLYPYDIQGSIAHANMLGKQGILKKNEVKKINQGLKKILKKIQSDQFVWDLHREDVHLNIEAALIEAIGPVGGKLHTARSRNDQVATDLRLYCRDQVKLLTKLLRNFQKSLIEQANKHIDTLIPGYTHLQRAQPISLAHHFLAYFEMAERDIHRLKDSLKRTNTLPLGSGALAGTTFNIDRKAVAAELGFDSVSHNSLDSVSDRDFVIEILSHLSILMMHLSRFAEEWILWSSQEFQFIKLPEEFCTGSSMMPQKINPDILELIRGKTGRVFGSLQSLLVTLKGLPLAYNKDMQEDKEPLFDAIQTTQASLQILTAMIPATQFNQKAMQEALSEGFVLATDLADYISTKGIPFRQAHRIVGEIVAFCQKNNRSLENLTIDELKIFSKKFDQEVFDWLQFDHSVDRRNSIGGTARKRIMTEIKRAKRIIKS